MFHGDIKTENILVTSWNWLYLSDFSSSFKKTYLPEDNPADFSYFFDISGRRTCYLAPERFLGTGEQDDGRGVTWAMDVFSVGCVIAELFVEAPIFSLSQLFKYRKGEYDPTYSHLSKIEDRDVRELVTHMIQVEPESRYSAEEYLNFWRRKAFPEYFYSFLHQYMGLITDPSSGRTPVDPEKTNFGEADERVDRIYYDFDKISYFLGYDDDKDSTKNCQEAIGEFLPVQINIPNNRHSATSKRTKPVDDGTLIFLTLVVSSIRNTARATSRLRACDLMLAFAERITDEAKLDRVLPFLVTLLTDKSDVVKLAALRSIAQLLTLIQVVSPVNAYVFTEYVRPRLQNIIEGPSSKARPVLRATYAACLASLAHSSLNILDMIQALRAGGSIPTVDPEAEDGSATDLVYKNLYDVARADLVAHFESHTKALLTDSDASVRRAFLRSVSSLCIFFGPGKANDVILSHLNTYLNDKDWMLKCAFFQTIVGVATYVGSANLEDFILPLMFQSLTDPEEFVVERALRSFASMAELGLLQRSKCWEVIDLVARFTVHPNTWIREAAVHFITATTGQLSAVDNRCIVLPLLRPFLRVPINELKSTAILDSLKKPLPRTILEMAFTWSLKVEKGKFWNLGSEQKAFSFRGPEQSIPILSSKQLDANTMKRLPKNEEDEQWLTRLRHLGMTSDDELKLLALREYVQRTGAKRSKMSDNDKSISFGNVVSLTELNVVPQTVIFDNNEAQTKSRRRESMSQAHQARSERKHTITDALLDASITADGPLASRGKSHANSQRQKNSENSRALDIPRNRLEASNQVSPLSSSPDTRASSLDHIATRGKLPTQASTQPNRGNEARSDSTVTPIGSFRDGKIPIKHRSSAMNLINRRDAQKSVAETGTISTHATGEIEGRVPDEGAGDDAQDNVAEDLERRAGHTYEGHDPSVTRLLDNLATENYPVDQYDFGPLVNPISRRARRTDSNQPDVPWRPQGIHIATFGEHSAAITRVLPSPDHIFFITASDDGTVKVWDTLRLEKSLVHKSRQTHKHAGGAKVKCITFVENTHAFVSCATDGSVNVVKVDCIRSSDDFRYGRPRIKRSYKLPADEYAVWCEHFRQDGKSTLVIATSGSRIIALDLRTMSKLYTLSIPLSYGLPTCFVIDRRRTWLLVGTGRGILCLFDLRFRLAVKSWALSGATPIRRLALHPSTKARGKLVCVLGGTLHADVTIWDVVSSTCKEVFRASSLGGDKEQELNLKDTAKSYQPVTISDTALLANSSLPAVNSPLRAMAIGNGSVPDERDSRYSYLITGGTDRRVRFWDLIHVEGSVTVNGLATDELQPSYSTVNPSPGLSVNIEKQQKEDRSKGKDRSKRKIGRMAEMQREQKALLRSHLDDITDVMVLEGTTAMVVSVDRRGCLYAYQ